VGRAAVGFATGGIAFAGPATDRFGGGTFAVRGRTARFCDTGVEWIRAAISPRRFA